MTAEEFGRSLYETAVVTFLGSVPSAAVHARNVYADTVGSNLRIGLKNPNIMEIDRVIADDAPSELKASQFYPEELATSLTNDAPASSEPSPERVLPPTRMDYENEVILLKKIAEEKRTEEADPETLARLLFEKRDALKKRYLEVTPLPLLDIIKRRNIREYGNPGGPTIEHLRAKGKTWEQIIESATRPGGTDINFNTDTDPS